MNKFPIGTRVVISKGSGLSSNRCGMIAPQSAVKTDGHGIPTNVGGAYQPVDWERESAVMLDDGILITMFDDRIQRYIEEAIA